MLTHVIEACSESADHMSTKVKNGIIRSEVAVLTPYEDPIVAEFGGKVQVIQGPEDDVLNRYEIACQAYTPDYVVRITGDCPYLPPFIISSHVIKAALSKPPLDYCTNTLEEIRTAPDGYDVEVMSMRMMRYLFANAESVYDKEHVTSLLRRAMPVWAEVGAVIGHRDESNVKISVDTYEDRQRVSEDYENVKTKLKRAESQGYRVFRL